MRNLPIDDRPRLQTTSLSFVVTSDHGPLTTGVD